MTASYRAIAAGWVECWMNRHKQLQAERQLTVEAGQDVRWVDMEMNICVRQAEWFATEYVQWRVELEAEREAARTKGVA